MTPLTRRTVMTAAGGAALALPARIRALAAGRTDGAKLIVVMLRGAMDGLAAVPPWAGRDRSAYEAARPRIAVAREDMVPLTAEFGLHRAFTGLAGLWARRSLIVVHAVAPGLVERRDRSHFSMQDLLEQGGDAPGAVRTGWLGRALAASGAGRGVSCAPAVPVSLLADAPDVGLTVAAPFNRRLSPSLVAALNALYADAPGLRRDLSDGLMLQAAIGDLSPRDQRDPFAAVAALMKADRELALNAAVIDVGGWDTHVAQGAGTGELAERMAGLDTGLSRLAADLGPVWERTVVVVLTEFGRRIEQNGAQGTDHGMGGAAFVLGGPVRGGRLIGDWPGLAEADRQDGLDLKPTLDTRALLKGVLRDHWGVDRRDLDAAVFPSAAPIRPLDGLLR